MSPARRARIVRLVIYIAVVLLAAWWIHSRYLAIPPAPPPKVALPQAEGR
jgi:hypothetical protein